MNDFWKMITTAIIWTICGGIILAMTIQGVANNVAANWVLVLPLLAAVLTTLVIWAAGQGGTQSREAALRESGKAKRLNLTRDDKMAMLMDMMDEDERAAFKAALARKLLDDDRDDNPFAEDGELPLGELLDEQRRRQRR